MKLEIYLFDEYLLYVEPLVWNFNVTTIWNARDQECNFVFMLLMLQSIIYEAMIVVNFCYGIFGMVKT
jgi:hypothetical protein